MKAGTHSASLKESHTTAYTSKQGPSLPRPQCGFVPPAKFLLVRHAFIYIHFPVLCEPPLYQQREKIRQSCCHKFYPQPFLIPIFNFSHKRPTFAFTGKSGYTLGFRRKIAHKGTHGETGAFRAGVVSLPSDRFARFRNHAWPGVRTALPLLGLGRVCSRRAQRACGTATRSCASLFRGVAAPLGCVICLQLGDVAVFSLCAQYFLNVRGGGRYLHPRTVSHGSETLRGQVSERQTLPLLGLGRRHS